ncbi:MAG: hypothetical protein RLY93_19590 [Sumerlaeia bacterium]
MKSVRHLPLFAAAAAVGLALPALAQLTISGSTFEPSGVASGGGLTMYGIVGQPDAQQASGGGLTLNGGFLTPGLDTPLLVELARFDVVPQGNGAQPLLTWETLAEIDNAGFHVYRAEPLGGGWVRGERLTAGLIAAEGLFGSGATYTFADPEAYAYGSGERAYFLEDVDLSGRVTLHGPVFLNEAGEAASVRDWSLF